MKKYTLYKTVQLALLILAAVAIMVWVFPDSSIFHYVATDPTAKFLIGSLWFVLLVSFVFILLDYTFFFGYIKEYKEMDYAVKTDPLSGISNRFSCDVMIEKYSAHPLPANVGCIMLEITNIQSINKDYGHLCGNTAIKGFSNMLRLASGRKCFVGRNGGNKFLAIFEAGTPEAMQKFISSLDSRLDIFNNTFGNPIVEYKYGSAFSGSDGIDDILELITLANSRIADAEVRRNCY